MSPVVNRDWCRGGKNPPPQKKETTTKSRYPPPPQKYIYIYNYIYVTVPSRNQILFQFFSSASKCTRRCLVVPRGHNSQKNEPQKSWNNIWFLLGTVTYIYIYVYYKITSIFLLQLMGLSHSHWLRLKSLTHSPASSSQCFFRKLWAALKIEKVGWYSIQSSLQ